MTRTQKIVKYCAIALAIFLIVSIFSGIIDLFTSIIFAFSKDSDWVGEMKPIALSDTENIKNLDITVGAAELEIKNGEVFSLESNAKYLKAQIKNDTLLIEEDIPFRLNRGNSITVILTIPTDFSFERAEFETGAGKISVESLSVGKLRMELGAGETRFENLIVSDDAEIETGIGEFSILGGRIADLDLQMGVGDVSIKTALSGECELDCGISNTDLCLIGEKDDYRISVNKGIGSATVDGEKISNDEEFGNGNVTVKINGGIGDIRIQFARE